MAAASITTHALLSLIRRHPGIDLGALERETQVHRRTLQRRLAGLLAQGEITSQRFQRSVIFMMADKHAAREPQTPYGAPSQSLPASRPEETPEDYVRTSPAGEEVKALVRRPVHLRKYVGYDVKFLEAYYPNGTFYLPEDLRAQLHQMGRSPEDGAPAGTFARRILDRLLIDLSWASSRLEGNTYSRLDTERLLQLGQTAEGKKSFETTMILNHKAAIQYLVDGAGNIGINPRTIKQLHALLSDDLMPDPMTCGTLRQRIVEIGGSVYLPPAVPQSIEELFGIVLDFAAAIEDPFEQSFFLMVHLPYLQPFEDVNKRVSRLAANIPLIKANLSPLSFIDMPQRAYVDGMLGVYELNRIELLRDVFVWAYERSCGRYVAVRQHMVTPDPFDITYRQALSEVVRGIVRGGLRLNKTSIRKLIPKSVEPADRAQFLAMVEKKFESIHADNAVRFGLRPLEFEAWKKRG